MKKNAPRNKAKDQQEIPEDLQALLGSLNALATIHDLLQKGSFPYEYRNAIASSIRYIEALHKQVLSEAKSHPQAHLSPELNAANRTPKEQEKLDKEFLEIVEKTIEPEAVQ